MLADLLAAAHARPEDVEAQMAAAYACDRDGRENEAVVYYDAAYRLGVPAAARVDFLLGYGSTLRNVGRLADSLRVLEALLDEDPDHHAARCFHALAQRSAGKHAHALAELIDVALSLRGESPSLRRYQRALTEYRDELRRP